jgi:hypothetical protein
VLRVDAIHEDEPFDETLRAEVGRELDDFAACLELDLYVVPSPNR